MADNFSQTQPCNLQENWGMDISGQSICCWDYLKSPTVLLIKF